MGELCEEPSLRDRPHPFRDRAEGGRHLATLLKDWASEEAILLAIPPSGVPVAMAVANELALPMELFFAQRIDHPLTGDRIGGISWKGRVVWERTAVRRCGLVPRELRGMRRSALDSIQTRSRRYGAKLADLETRAAILVDDGTSGWPTLLAAIREIRSIAPRTAVALPMCTRSEVLRLVNEVDMLFCPSVGKEERIEARGGYWRHPFGELEALAMWAGNKGQKPRYVYHTVSSSSGIPHDR